MNVDEMKEKVKNLPNTLEVSEQRGVIDKLQKQLKEAQQELDSLIKKFQRNCSHAMASVVEYDKNYSPRVDGQCVGMDVFIGKVCEKCGLFEPRKDGCAFNVCYKCGGDMEYAGRTYYGDMPVHVHKCEDCGHEYDTT